VGDSFQRLTVRWRGLTGAIRGVSDASHRLWFKMKKRSLLFLAVGVVVVLLTMLAPTGCRVVGEERASWAASFEPHLGEYLPGSLRPEQASEATYIRDGLVLVNEGTGELDELNYFKALADLRAASPEEVGTVVWTKYSRSLDHWTRSILGTTNYYNNQIHITVVDFIDKKVWGSVVFNSPLPVDAEPIDDSPLTERVIEFLQSLPRR
jgi:hypothetical protein